MRRLLIILASITGGLLLLTALALVWLQYSSAGARWVLGFAEDAGLEIRSVDGSLARGLELRGLRWFQEGTRLELGHLDLSLHLAWTPPRLIVDAARGRDIRLTLESAESPEDSPAPTDLSSPLTVEIRDLQLRDVLISMDGQEYPFSRIQGALRYGERLDIDRLIATGPDLALNIRGEASLTAPFRHQLTTALALAEDHSLLPDAELHVQAQGSTDRTSVELRLDGPQRLRGSAELRDLLAQPRWNLTITGNALHWPPQSPAWQLADTRLQFSGSLEDYELQLDTTLSGDSLPTARWQLQGQGNTQQLQIRSLTGDPLDGRLQAEGELTWAPDVALDLSLAVEGMVPDDYLSGWPAQHPLQGNARLRWQEDSLIIDDLDMALADTAVRLQGGLQLSDTRLLADLDWQALRWPLDGEPLLISPDGSLSGSGTPDDYSVQVDAGLRFPDYGEGRLQLSGRGNTEQLMVESLQANWLNGTLAGDAMIAWAPQLRWQASLTADHLDPAPLYPSLNGQLDADIQAAGGEDGRFRLDIRQLQGQLQQRPVSGRGIVEYRPDTGLRMENVDLRSGEARLQADGNPAPAADQAFSARLQIPDLSQWMPDAQGQLQSRLDRAPGGPLAFEISASELRLGAADTATLASERLTASGEARLHPQGFSRLPGMLTVEATLEEATVAGEPIEWLQLVIDSQLPDADARLQWRNQRGDVELSLNGVLSGLSGTGTASTAGTPATADMDVSPLTWSGSLETLRLEHRRFGQWRLRAPASAVFSAEEARLDDLCLVQDSADGCFSGAWSASGDAALSGRFDRLPLGLNGLFLDHGMRLSHTLSGTIDWQRSGTLLGRGSADLSVSPGRLRWVDADLPPILTEQAGLQLELSPEGALDGRLELPLRGGGGLDLDLNVENLRRGSERPLSGQARIEVATLGILPRLVPALDGAGGRLDLDVRFRGTLDQPRFDGQLSVRDGTVQYVPLGLALNDLNLSGRFSDEGRLSFAGGFVAGEGNGQIDGSLAWEDGIRGRLNLRGSSLQVIDAPTIQLKASPDLRLELSPEQLAINGRVEIPEALVAPEESEYEVITESDDVVVINDDRPAPVTREEARSPIDLAGELTVVLGDSVRYDGGDTEIRLGGSVVLNWNGEDYVPIADGRIALVEGRYRAYGQLLTIEDSALIFRERPADNPRLQIRAVREIFGDPAVEKAGVRITGTADDPEVRVFTDPPSNEETALAYVVTGSDFDHGSGVGALSVGTYVFPRLFVSYGFGLFEETGNVISAKYEFSRNWGIRTVSGDRDTGVDVSYTVDK